MDEFNEERRKSHQNHLYILQWKEKLRQGKSSLKASIRRKFERGVIISVNHDRKIKEG